MRKSLTTLICGLSCGLFLAPADAENPDAVITDPQVPCEACHTCQKPTPENLCLRSCTRTLAAAANEAFQKRVPDMVILNELEDLYLPVPFDHKGHASMAEMTRGCEVCHHYTPEGTEHPACKSCHEVSPIREDMRKPGLKGAYHRQCLSCHREWSHETACEICHQPKAGRGQGPGQTEPPRKDDIMGRMHPPIPEPDVTLYQTKYKEVTGTRVLFRHKEHIHRFGFRCAECHREDSCSRCHEEGKSEAEREKTLEEHHNPCSQCHDMKAPNLCDHCHRLESEPEPPPFDHASTGWPLGRYHENANCRACHIAVKFVKLDRECNKCHGGWNAETFDHAVTGQLLDEHHAEAGCEECHLDRKFDAAPGCLECHEEEEGIAFPAKRPGPVAGTESAPATKVEIKQ